MLPISHLVPTSLPLLPAEAVAGMERDALAGAFSTFIAAASKLELSYRDLQGEVAELDRELAARNISLENSLLQNESMRLELVALVDSMPCGVLVLSASGAVERMNPEARMLLGLAHGTPADLDAIAAITGIHLQPFASIAGESEIQAGHGKQTRWLELRTRILPPDEVGGDSRSILILRDISAHKHAEQDRESGRRALALAEVTATLAHEIRNPLASMELFADLLETEPSRAAEWLGHMRAGLRGLGHIVANVLSFHAAGAPGLRPVALAEPVAAAAEFMRPVAAQPGVRLSIHAPGTELLVLANDSALRQVVQNLVANAVRHTAAGGEVRVSVQASAAGRPLLEVRDTGCGIAAEHLAHIFDAGWSARGTSPGLGLAVCMRIAKQHGAVLTANAPADGGACFQMEFPCL